MTLSQALTFDDVLLVPAKSAVAPTSACVATRITRSISLGMPLISAAMDTVTESNMAIALAQLGGLGVIHKNLDPSQQTKEVSRVKRFEAGMVIDPLTIHPEQPLSDALELMARHKISGIPVVKRDVGTLVGILTNRDVRFATEAHKPIADYMTSDNLVTVGADISQSEAKALLHKHRIEKLLVVDGDGRCVGLRTVKDIEKAESAPNACKDERGRLRVAAAIGTGDSALARARELLEAGVDVLVVDVAHGHSVNVIRTVKGIKDIQSNAQVIAGNVVTAQAAKDLIEAGADAIKVGVGPGSICTTRMVAGVGMPQFTAITDVVATTRDADVPLISDGGIKFSGDLAKAIAAGADCCMLGSLLAGAHESPGEVFFHQGRSYKSYRGMGSLGAMARGSADRYFQEDVRSNFKLVPEGVEGFVPYKGNVADIIHQLLGGLRASMGYTGNATIEDMQRNCQFRHITASGLREGHVHDVIVSQEPPNYHVAF